MKLNGLFQLTYCVEQVLPQRDIIKFRYNLIIKLKGNFRYAHVEVLWGFSYSSLFPSNYLITVTWNLRALITKSEQKNLCISTIRIGPIPDKSHTQTIIRFFRFMVILPLQRFLERRKSQPGTQRSIFFSVKKVKLKVHN